MEGDGFQIVMLSLSLLDWIRRSGSAVENPVGGERLAEVSVLLLM